VGFDEARDREDLHRFFAEHKVALMKFAHFLTGNHHDAQDLLGATAERLAKSWGRSRRRNLPYAKKIMRNISVDMYRAKKARPREVDLTGLEGTSAGPDVDEEVEIRGRISRVMRSLNARQLEVFTLHAHDGVSFEEIASRLFVSESTVRNDWNVVSKRLYGNG
jgi:RNA polymerase sigma factor (sigma-70 family)